MTKMPSQRGRQGHQRQVSAARTWRPWSSPPCRCLSSWNLILALRWRLYWFVLFYSILSLTVLFCRCLWSIPPMPEQLKSGSFWSLRCFSWASFVFVHHLAHWWTSCRWPLPPGLHIISDLKNLSLVWVRCVTTWPKTLLQWYDGNHIFDEKLPGHRLVESLLDLHCLSHHWLRTAQRVCWISSRWILSWRNINIHFIWPELGSQSIADKWQIRICSSSLSDTWVTTVIVLLESNLKLEPGP